MAKLEKYNGTVKVLSGLNTYGEDYPLMDAHYVQTSEDGKRLDAELEEIKESIENIDTSGSSITVDEALSAASTNPVQNKVITQKVNELEQAHPILKHTVYPTDEQKANKDMTGWYRIAETTASGYWSNVFHLQATVMRSTYTSDVIFTAERMSYNSNPSIGVLSYASQDAPNDMIDDVIDMMRIVYEKSKTSGPKTYLEVHINKNSTQDDAWDGTGVSTGYTFTVETFFRSSRYNWTVITPILVAEELDTTEYDWTSYDKSPITSAWSQVTVSVDELNNLPKQIGDMATIVNLLNQGGLK